MADANSPCGGRSRPGLWRRETRHPAPQPEIRSPARRRGTSRARTGTGSRPSRWLRLVTFVLGAALCLAAVPPVSAQQLVPKPVLVPGSPADPCRTPATPAAAGAAPSAAVDSLLAAGSTAAILGDSYTAGELLREAAARDPGNPVIAYRLGRIYDERGEIDLALGEYCRYLAVAPRASESEHVRDRVRALSEAASSVDLAEVEAAARTALRAMQEHRYGPAVRAFDRTIEMRPDWAEAYYNRGVAHAALRQYAAAISDLQQYLEIHPEAPDRPAVSAAIEALRAGAMADARRAGAPAAALASGLVVPGLGQVATGRPAGGLLVLAGAAGAVFWGVQEDRVTRTETALDPFGNPYDIQVTATERPNLALGLGVAAALALTGATEAYLFARRHRSTATANAEVAAGVARLGLHLAPTPDLQRMEVGVRIGGRASP